MSTRGCLATLQVAYDEAVVELQSGLDRAEALLSHQRYLVGSTLTEADIRLFVTLIRWDEVYAVYFKTNFARIVDYPNLLNFCRDVYQLPGLVGAVRMDHIRTGYYSSHPARNTYAPRAANRPVNHTYVRALEIPDVYRIVCTTRAAAATVNNTM